MSVATVQPGCRVRVPFGARCMAGLVVTRGGEASAGAKLRSLDRLLDPSPVVSPGMIDLPVAAADYVFSARHRAERLGWGLASRTPVTSATRTRDRASHLRAHLACELARSCTA